MQDLARLLVAERSSSTCPAAAASVAQRRRRELGHERQRLKAGDQAVPPEDGHEPGQPGRRQRARRKRRIGSAAPPGRPGFAGRCAERLPRADQLGALPRSMCRRLCASSGESRSRRARLAVALARCCAVPTPPRRSWSSIARARAGSRGRVKPVLRHLGRRGAWRCASRRRSPRAGSRGRSVPSSTRCRARPSSPACP